MSAGGKLSNWLHTQKDNSVSFVAEKILRNKLEPYGCLTEFKLDSRKNSAWLTVVLKGEAQPVTLEVREYEVAEDASGHFVIVKQAAASREWLNVLLQDFLIGRRWPIPEKYAAYARMLL